MLKMWNEGASYTEIAEKLGTYTNYVRRALQRLGAPKRDRSKIVKNALERGRLNHPTKGKERTAEEKEKISQGVAESWSSMDVEQVKEIKQMRKEQWAKTPDEKKDEMRNKAAVQLKVAATSGSKLEKYLLTSLKTLGYIVDFHTELVVENENMHLDMYLPKEKIAIEIDGPTHYQPIYGEERLERVQEADIRKNGMLLNHGITVIRLQLSKGLSDVKKRMILAETHKYLKKHENPKVITLNFDEL